MEDGERGVSKETPCFHFKRMDHEKPNVGGVFAGDAVSFPDAGWTGRVVAIEVGRLARVLWDHRRALPVVYWTDLYDADHVRRFWTRQEDGSWVIASADLHLWPRRTYHR